MELIRIKDLEKKYKTGVTAMAFMLVLSLNSTFVFATDSKTACWLGAGEELLSRAKRTVVLRPACRCGGGVHLPAAAH